LTNLYEMNSGVYIHLLMFLVSVYRQHTWLRVDKPTDPAQAADAGHLPLYGGTPLDRHPGSV